MYINESMVSHRVLLTHKLNFEIAYIHDEHKILFCVHNDIKI